jgi:DNA-binding Lrp family transcriptional regulator
MSDKRYARDLILAVLQKSSPKSMRELETEIGISYQRVRTAIKEMRELDRPKLHISEWRPVDAYHMIAYFSYGYGRDVPKPPKTPKIILSRRSRQRMKARKIEKEAEATKKKVIKELQRPAFRHPQDIALFGPPPIICPTEFRGNLHIQPMEVEDEIEVA